MYAWRFSKDGNITFLKDGQPVFMGYSAARAADGRRIDTHSAAFAGADSVSATYRAENGLVLTQRVTGGALPTIAVELSDASGAEIGSNSLTPLNIWGGDCAAAPLFNELFSKMLLCPYDNTMWMRYEALPFRAGRRSYDFTVIFNEDKPGCLLLGATDFGTWKNAVTCSAVESRQFVLTSGVADDGTHDSEPHGIVRGKTVASAPFLCLFEDDWRRTLETYGDELKRLHAPLEWKHGVPFGFNSWAGLAFDLNAENFREAGRLFREELRPAGYSNDGVQYINFDARWEKIDPDTRLEIVSELHANGQRVGVYDAPFACFAEDLDAEIPDLPGHTYRELLLRNDAGELVQRVDGAWAYDVTHPLWREMEKNKTDYYIAAGFDYAKFDFISHGGAEGKHYDPAARTGREALTQAYRYLDELLSEERAGHPFFISLSIAPLFPHGYAHARRFSCDAFGTNEDVEYVLNAQTYGWWESGRLYALNDPDHIVMLKGYFAARDSEFEEARARYTASAICGTVMMLSDRYSREEAVRRTKILTANRAVNAVAASGVSFTPVRSNGCTASHAFSAEIRGVKYLALFCWDKKGEPVTVTEKALPGVTGEWTDLWSGKKYTAGKDGLRWSAPECTAVLLKKE